MKIYTNFEVALSDGVDDEAAVAANVTDIGTDDCCAIGGCCGRVAVAA